MIALGPIGGDHGISFGPGSDYEENGDLSVWVAFHNR